MFCEKINVTRSSMPDFDEYCEEIKELWDSHWLTNNGSKHQELERSLCEYLGVENVTLFCNGHLALENILASFDFPKGGEVITSPFTFASTTHAIVRSGLKPVFCDVKEDDYTIDTEKLESLITEKTVAILPIHVYGNICDAEEIEKIGKKYSLKIIYDAAHAFGVIYKGRSVASLGDASMFSFHATKVFNTIEGGAAVYADPGLKAKLDILKNFGISYPDEVSKVGGNAKMNEFAAAMGICNLRHLAREIEKRKAVVEAYNGMLSGIFGIKLSKKQVGVTPNYAYYPVVFDGYKYNRDEITERLARENVAARKYFYPITNSFECYRELSGTGADKTPIAKYYSERVITLPLYADLAPSDAEKICEIILK